jgi:hypothetical protein
VVTLVADATAIRADGEKLVEQKLEEAFSSGSADRQLRKMGDLTKENTLPPLFLAWGMRIRRGGRKNTWKWESKPD